MSVRPFDQLPNEILLHVFIKGVEDDGYDHRRSCRRLKAFARLARQVCARWRTIVDNPPSSVSFWITCLLLRAHFPGYLREPSFAKQLATFRHLLLSSNGCDLAISFDFYHSSEEILFPFTSPITRLIIHAMDMIMPHHNQVIELGVCEQGACNAAPVVHLYLLKLVATRWVNTPRLLTVTFRGITSTPSELSLRSLPGYDKILSETSKEVSSPLSLAHFRNLDTLMIPVGLWIKRGVLLPPNLQHLTLMDLGDVTIAKLFGFLQTQTNSFKNLQSIRIVRAEKINSQEQAKRPTGQSLGQINLPLLHRMSLDAIFARDVLGFLGILSCRSLESLSIMLRGHEEIDQNSLSINFPLKFPRLTSTKLMISVEAWQSLHYLGMFTSLPIQWLRVFFHEYKSDWVDHLVSFRTALSNLRLQELQMVMNGPYWVSHYLLALLDTQNLTRLEMNDLLTRRRRPQWLPPMDRDSEILAPHLKELKFHNSEDHLIHFLSHLEATQLVYFKYISIGSASTDWDREKALQALSTKSFVSVRSAHLQISRVNQFLPQLVHIFPNLDQLQIRIESRGDDVMYDDVVLFLIRDVIQPLCDGLAPTITTVLLPHLRSISADCSVFKSRKSQSKAKWSDVTREDVRRIVQEMLTSHAKGGGLPLQMDSIEFEERFNYMNAKVTFEAREASSVIETNSPQTICE